MVFSLVILWISTLAHDSLHRGECSRRLEPNRSCTNRTIVSNPNTTTGENTRIMLLIDDLMISTNDGLPYIGIFPSSAFPVTAAQEPKWRSGKNETRPVPCVERTEPDAFVLIY